MLREEGILSCSLPSLNPDNGLGRPGSPTLQRWEVRLAEGEWAPEAGLKGRSVSGGECKLAEECLEALCKTELELLDEQ